MYNRRLESLIERYLYKTGNTKNKIIFCESNCNVINVKEEEKKVDRVTYSGMKYNVYKRDFIIFLDKEGYKDICLDDLLIASALHKQSLKHLKQIYILVLAFFILLIVSSIFKL